MENAAIRLERLQKSLTGQSDVCSSGGPVRDFPESFRNGFRNFGIGLIVCTQGEFRFSLASGAYTAAAGETVFIPEDTPFRITGQSEDMEVSILIYKVQPIKDILGNLVYSVHLYSRMSPDLPCVWKTGDEEDIITYMTLIGTDTPSDDNLFAVYERKLLLLSLTYRLCAISNGNTFPDRQPMSDRRKSFSGSSSSSTGIIPPNAVWNSMQTNCACRPNTCPAFPRQCAVTPFRNWYSRPSPAAACRCWTAPTRQCWKFPKSLIFRILPVSEPFPETDRPLSTKVP